MQRLFKVWVKNCRIVMSLRGRRKIHLLYREDDEFGFGHTDFAMISGHSVGHSGRC